MSENPETNNATETPVEIAPEAVVPDGEQGTEGTAAQPDPTAAQPAPEKPDDKSAEFFQAKYQEAQTQLKAQGGGQSSDQGQPQPAVPVVDRAQSTQLPAMSHDELNDTLRENPALGYQAVTNEMTTRMQSMIEQGFAKAEATATRRVEEQNAQRVVNEFISTAGISQKMADDAKASVMALVGNANVSPNAIAQMTLQAVQVQQIMGGSQQATTQAAADAAQAAKTQVLTQQPDGGSLQEAAPKTQKQKIANAFTPSEGKQILDQLSAGKVN